MPPRYFKPETLIETRCEHCGAHHKETLARLYSDARLLCIACGKEHTVERQQFRQNIMDTEAAVDTMSSWADTLLNKANHWWQDRQPR